MPESDYSIAAHYDGAFDVGALEDWAVELCDKFLHGYTVSLPLFVDVETQ